jgi:hypothetical protein
MKPGVCCQVRRWEKSIGYGEYVRMTLDVFTISSSDAASCLLGDRRSFEPTSWRQEVCFVGLILNLLVNHAALDDSEAQACSLGRHSLCIQRASVWHRLL